MDSIWGPMFNPMPLALPGEPTRALRCRLHSTQSRLMKPRPGVPELRMSLGEVPNTGHFRVYQGVTQKAPET